MPQVLTFDELTDNPSALDAIGNKGRSLIELRTLGFRVPAGMVIAGDAFVESLERLGLQSELAHLAQTELTDSELESTLASLRQRIIQATLPQTLVDSIQSYLQAYPDDHWAVRSSGNLEDLQQQSFAGLYETYLNQTGLDQVLESIKACWASAFTPRVLTYLANHDLTLSSLKMSVVVQQMVAAEKSGVVFSVNPMTAEDCEILVEACHGLGEQLVSGHVTPQQKIYDWRRQDWLQTTGDNVLTDPEALTVCQAAIEAQAAFGFPVDLEWALADGELFLLQSRPITAIHYDAHNKAWTTADFKDGGVSSSVCTPLMWSLYQMVWEDAVPEFLKIVGLLNPNEHHIQWGRMFYGRPYWNLTDIKRFYSLLPGYVERQFDEDLGIEPVYDGDGKTTALTLKSLYQGIQLLARLKASLRRRSRQWPTTQAFFQQRLQHYENLSERDLSGDQIAALVKSFIREHYYQNEKNYFLHIFHVSVFSSLFGDAFKKVDTPVQSVDLMSALGNLSHLKLNVGIWRYSRAILADPNQANYWQHHSLERIVEHYQADASQPPGLHELVQAFKHHSSRELDIAVPNFDEDPKWIVQSVKNSLALDDSHDPIQLNTANHQQFLRHKAQYLQAVPWWKRRAAAKQLSQFRALLWWREEFRDLSSQYYYWMRRLALIAGRHLVQQSVIERAEDVFFLSQSDLIDTLEQRLPASETAAIIDFNRRYYQSFRHFDNPNEIGNGQPAASRQPSSPNALQGVGCSPGQVTGRIRVVTDIFDSDRIQEGDILITRFTDPGWTPKFALIKGVATEAGGVLSHAAVISREYGIPAVLAVPALTQRLKDGQTVLLDGNNGSITVLESSAP